MSTNKGVKLHQHPEYKKESPKWKKYFDMHEGDHEVMKQIQYLWLHELEANKAGEGIGKEGAKLRAVREMRSRYLNLIEPIISRWLSFLFRGEIAIPPSVVKVLGEDEGIKDISGDNTSFETFIREKIGFNYVLYGKPIVLVDTAPVQATTIADGKARGARAYMDIVNPLEMVDWQYSDDPARSGKLQLARTEYSALAPRQDETDEPKLELWSRVFKIKDGKYIQQRYKATRTEQGGQEWELSGEPIVYDKTTEIPIALANSASFIKDAAETQLLCFNYMSALSSALNAQAFQRIFVAGEDDPKSKYFINENLISFIDADATVTSVEPFNSTALENAVNKSIDWTFLVAFNKFEGLSAQSKESPGADARKQMKDDFIALVTTSLTEIESVINEAIKHYAILSGKPVPEQPVTLDKSITEDDIEKELQILHAHADKFKKIASVTKGILKKHVKALNLENEDEALKEIEAADFSEDTAQSETANQRASLLRDAMGQPNEPEPVENADA